MLTRREWLELAAWGACAAGRAAAEGGLEEAAFLNPPMRHRGVALWLLNDKIELGEAERQLRGFKEAGWGGVTTRTFMGTRIAYLGDEWKGLIDRIVSVSRQQGTRVFLQQADTKVGGYVSTALLGMEDRFRHRLLIQAAAGEKPEGPARLIRSVGPRSYYEFMAAPAGEMSQFMAVMDLLDEATVKEYIRRSYDAQYAANGADFGTTIEAIWMDEPFIRHTRYTRAPALPWTPKFPELFQKDWGYSILDHLPSLFEEEGDWQKVRHHFWRTAVGQFKRAYWEPVGRWCREHKVKFAGHLMGEDTLNDQIAWSGAIMPFFEDMQLPGIDYLTKDISTWRPPGSKFLVTPKQLSSVVNQLGQSEALCEMYGVSDQNLSFEDRKWIAEWLAVLGINCRCYHGSFYSMRGVRKRIYPPHLSYQQPWWVENRRIADPMARLSYALSQGQYVAEALVLHPLESAHCLFDPGSELTIGGGGNKGPNARLAAMDQELITLSDHLMSLHVGFDYGDEYLMSKYGRVKDGALEVGRMRYRVVILPSLLTLRASTVKLLAAFAEAGGKLLSIGQVPTRVDGVVDASVEAVSRHARPVDNAVAALRQELGAASVELQGAGTGQVWVHERRLGEDRIYFLANTSRTRAAEFEFRLKRAGRLERWDLERGRQETPAQWSLGSSVAAQLALPPAGSALLVFRAGAPVRAGQPAKPVTVRTVPLEPRFVFQRHDPNALTLDFCRFRVGEGAWSGRMPVIGVLEKLTRQKYNGPVRLEYRFQVKEKPSACRLAAEDTEQCRISVNGKEVKRQGEAWYRDRGFHTIDITAQLRAGENLVEVAREYRAPEAGAIRDQTRFYGTDLEAVYVIGDFAVRGGDFALDLEEVNCGRDLVAGGYPFYAGRFTLIQELKLERPRPGERAYLDLGPLRATLAVVRLNGKDAGAVLWAPYRVELTGLIRGGDNRIEIDLVNSLRNLLGPHHYRGPKKNEQWGWSYSGYTERPDWMEPEVRPRLQTWSDAYEFVPFGIAESARIIYERNVISG